MQDTTAGAESEWQSMMLLESVCRLDSTKQGETCRPLLLPLIPSDNMKYTSQLHPTQM